jgi:2-phospho-L-lactate/phosphoenolpyruvate guanylyltransferase
VTCWAIIPIKGPDEAKRRLAGALDDAARRRLVARMLAQVTASVAAARGIDRRLVVAPAGIELAEGFVLHLDPGGGLNAAVSHALAAAAQGGATRAVVIAADLPQLTARDVELLAAAPPATIAIAPDRHETGTNALSLPLPAACDFPFAYGPDSFARHNAAAERLGLAIEIVESPGLMRDIDVPADLTDAAVLLEG